MKNLEELDLHHNKIKNIGEIAGLQFLNRLYLEENQITDLEALKNLKQLEILDLSRQKDQFDQIVLFNDDVRSDLQNALQNCEIHLGENEEGPLEESVD